MSGNGNVTIRHATNLVNNGDLHVGKQKITTMSSMDSNAASAESSGMTFSESKIFYSYKKKAELFGCLSWRSGTNMVTYDSRPLFTIYPCEDEGEADEGRGKLHLSCIAPMCNYFNTDTNTQTVRVFDLRDQKPMKQYDSYTCNACDTKYRAILDQLLYGPFTDLTVKEVKEWSPAERFVKMTALQNLSGPLIIRHGDIGVEKKRIQAIASRFMSDDGKITVSYYTKSSESERSWTQTYIDAFAPKVSQNMAENLIQILPVDYKRVVIKNDTLVQEYLPYIGDGTGNGLWLFMKPYNYAGDVTGHKRVIDQMNKVQTVSKKTNFFFFNYSPLSYTCTRKPIVLMLLGLTGNSSPEGVDSSTSNFSGSLSFTFILL
jgi:hypothetical protein